jgi:hypothetical protein
MSWFKPSEESKIPEKFRKMPVEDVAKVLEGVDVAVNEAKTWKEQVEATKTQLEARNNEFTELQKKVTALEASRRPDPQPDNKNKPPEFLEDPQGYVDARVSAAFNPLAQVALQTNAQLARESAKRTLDRLRVGSTKISKGAIFEKYSGEIDALAKTTPVQSLTSPDAWVHLFNMVLGQHMDEIIGAYSTGKGDEMFSEPGASNVTNNHDTPQPEKPTAQEIRVAQGMKIPIEEYMKRKKEMVFA